MARKPKPHPYQSSIDLAKERLAGLADVELSTHAYEVATVKSPGVSLVIYPHRSTAGHYHCRVRDNGSKDKIAAERVFAALDFKRKWK